MTVTKEALREMAIEVTGITPARWDMLIETLKVDAAMNSMMRDEWNRKPRDSEEAIREYYRESDIWFLNTWNHGVGALLEMAKAGAPPALAPWQAAFARECPKGEPILDYGGGFFKDTWPLARSGHKVFVAEIEGPVTEFLGRYVSLAGVGDVAGVVPVGSDAPLRDTYGGIACFETLEHLVKPVELTRHLHQHLRPGGPFAFSVSFEASTHAPYHVASNAPLGDPRVWAVRLGDIGFRPLWRDEVGQHTQIWRRT